MQETDSNLEYVHSKGYEILKFLDRVCKERDYKYFLAFGTLLGAVRHNGFIPWDDDIDIWMPRADFMKLFKYLKEENNDPCFKLNIGEYRHNGDRPSRFQLRILNTDSSITKIYAGKTINTYLWIDIFALDDLIIENKKSYLRHFKKRLFTYKIARSKTFYIKNKSIYSKVNWLIYTLHNKLGLFKKTFIEEKEIEKAYNALTKYHNSKEAKHYFNYAAVYLDRPDKCIYEKEWFKESIPMLFEDQEFPIPKFYHEILTTLYGDYMTIPKEHERHTHFVKKAESNNATAEKAE